MLLSSRNRSTFPSTDWRLVRATRRQPTSQTRGPAAELCSAYWYPVYAYLRRRGHRAEEAEDLTQGFFMHVLVKGLLERAQPEKGRLRSLLLASLTNFVANQRDQARALKRGARRLVSSEVGDAEARYLLEPADEVTPERIYERQWAAALLSRVLVQLRAEFVRAGNEHVFDVLKAHLTGEKRDAVYRHAAEALNVTEGAARVAAHRLRRRYRELLRIEIGRTVTGPEQDIDDEIRYLFSVTQHRAGRGASTLAVRP